MSQSVHTYSQNMSTRLLDSFDTPLTWVCFGIFWVYITFVLSSFLCEWPPLSGRLYTDTSVVLNWPHYQPSNRKQNVNQIVGLKKINVYFWYDCLTYVSWTWTVALSHELRKCNLSLIDYYLLRLDPSRLLRPLLEIWWRTIDWCWQVSLSLTWLFPVWLQARPGQVSFNHHRLVTSNWSCNDILHQAEPGCTPVQSTPPN